MDEIGYDNSLKSYLMGIFSLSGAYIRAGGGRFLYASLMCAMSNLLQVVSLFLPLKVLIIMSSSNSPFYFQYLTPYAEVETILTCLILAVPVIYIVYIVFSILYRQLLDTDFRKLKAEGMRSYFSKVNKAHVEKIHPKLSIALSEIFLVVITLVLMLFVNVYSAIVLLFFVMFNLFFLNKYIYGLKSDERRTKVSLDRKQIIEYLMSCNFMVIFFLLVLGVYYYSLNIFSAVLTLLIARMIFRSLARFSRQSFTLKELVLIFKYC